MLELLHIMTGALAWALIGLLGSMIVAVALVTAAGGTTRQLSAAFRQMKWHDTAILAAAAVLAVIYGGSKTNLKARSSADNGITLVSVVAENTNGVTRISAVSTGGSAEPMYYRQSVSNDWTAATADGWMLEISAYVPEPGIYSNAWTRSETDFTPCAMYWFGDHPPPVEVVTQGGVHIDAWRGSGRGVEVDWHIDEEIVIVDGTRIVLEYGAKNEMLGEAAEARLAPGSVRSGTLSVRGWFVGFVTRWRLKLEIPQ